MYMYILLRTRWRQVAGGPKIPMKYGRAETDTPEQCPKEGNLPAAEPPFPGEAPGPAKHLRDVFHRMGLTDKDIVALSGAHTLGRAHQSRSGVSCGKEATKYTSDGPGTKVVVDSRVFALIECGKI